MAAGFESNPPSNIHLEATAPSPAASSIRFVPPPLETLAAQLPQFEFLELLGQGGMGVVYKARQRALDRLVAIKILPAEIGHDAAFAERFAREARALAKLSHPNIVAVYDFGQTGEPEASATEDALFYIVMEFIDGANLRQTLRAGGMKPEQALAVVPQICDALQFAHDEGVVHRDIKPENILIDKRGRVRIADFGLAKMLSGEKLDAALTGTHQVMGTLRYMAPEQMEGTHDVDHRADIYSLGVVFYELLTGALPMGRFAAPSKMVQIDVRLDEVVLRALEKEPSQRYQNASDIKTGIESVSLSPAVRRTTPTPISRLVRRPGQTFPIRTLPRDGIDLSIGLTLTPIILGLFWILPGILAGFFASLFGLSGNTNVMFSFLFGSTVLYGLFLVLGSGSVQRLRVDYDGLTIDRYVGPSRSLPWSTIKRIEPMSRSEVIRQVWLWPGLPPRGSIVCMSSQGFYRINCQGDCWYFNPQQADQFLAAIERYQHPELDAANVEDPSAAEVAASPSGPRPFDGNGLGNKSTLGTGSGEACPGPITLPKPTYTRWVVVPMLLLIALWLGVSFAATLMYGQPGPGYRPMEVMRIQMLGGFAVAWALPWLLLMRWMKTLPGDVRSELRNRLLLFAVIFALGIGSLLTYFVSPWNQPHVESHSVTFRPQSGEFEKLTLGVHFVSHLRTTGPYYDDDRCEMYLQIHESGAVLRTGKYLEFPGFAEVIGSQREPMDRQRYLTWFHLSQSPKPGAQAEIDELFELLNAYKDHCPSDWDMFVTHAKTSLKHYDFGDDLESRNYIRGNPSGGFLYVFGGLLVLWLVASVWSVRAAARRNAPMAIGEAPK